MAKLPYHLYPSYPSHPIPSSRHGSQFDPGKYQLLHLSRKQRTDLELPLQLSDTQGITVKESVKYLGLNIDRKLLWNQHIKEIRAKATTGRNCWIHVERQLVVQEHETAVPSSRYSADLILLFGMVSVTE